MLRAMGPTEGVPTDTGPPVGLEKGCRPCLAGTITITVRIRPQQKAISEPPAMPPIVRTSFDLGFMRYLRRFPTDVTVLPETESIAGLTGAHIGRP